MLRRNESDVQSGQPLLSEQDTNLVTSGEVSEKHGSQGNSMMFDVEDPTPDAPSRRILGDGTTYHDRGWGYVFKVNVIVTILGAFCFGSLALEAISSDREVGGWGHRRLSEAPHTFGWLSASFIGLGLVALACSFAVGILHSLINCGKAVVWSLVTLTTLIWLWAILALAKHGLGILATPLALVFILTARFIYMRRARFHFGAANLKVAALAIKSMPGTIFISLYMSIVQVLWCSLSLIAALGSFAYLGTVIGSDGSTYRAIDCAFRSRQVAPGETSVGCFCMDEMISDGTCEYKGWGLPLAMVWIVSMLWGCAVIKNIVASTVSGSVAAWWFSPNDTKPVKGAFYRARHYSFGTLCKAGLIVNATRILFSLSRGVLRMVPGASCLFNLTQTYIEYVLRYTVTFVAIYGLNFADAVNKTRDVFARYIVTSVGNDTIISFSIAFLAFSTSLMFTLIYVVLLPSFMVDLSLSFQVVAPLVSSYIAFLFVMVTVLEVLRSSVKAIFVCFLQDPEVLKETHGRVLYDELTAAWVKIHPENNHGNLTAPHNEASNRAHVEVS